MTAAQRWGPTLAGDLMVGSRMIGANCRIVRVTGITWHGCHVRLVMDYRGVASETMHESDEVWATLSEETGT